MQARETMGSSVGGCCERIKQFQEHERPAAANRATLVQEGTSDQQLKSLLRQRAWLTQAHEELKYMAEGLARQSEVGLEHVELGQGCKPIEFMASSLTASWHSNCQKTEVTNHSCRDSGSRGGTASLSIVRCQICSGSGAVNMGKGYGLGRELCEACCSTGQLNAGLPSKEDLYHLVQLTEKCGLNPAPLITAFLGRNRQGCDVSLEIKELHREIEATPRQLSSLVLEHMVYDSEDFLSGKPLRDSYPHYFQTIEVLFATYIHDVKSLITAFVYRERHGCLVTQEVWELHELLGVRSDVQLCLNDLIRCRMFWNGVCTRKCLGYSLIARAGRILGRHAHHVKLSQLRAVFDEREDHGFDMIQEVDELLKCLDVLESHTHAHVFFLQRIARCMAELQADESLSKWFTSVLRPVWFERYQIQVIYLISGVYACSVETDGSMSISGLKDNICKVLFASEKECPSLHLFSKNSNLSQTKLENAGTVFDHTFLDRRLFIYVSYARATAADESCAQGAITVLDSRISTVDVLSQFLLRASCAHHHMPLPAGYVKGEGCIGHEATGIMVLCPPVRITSPSAADEDVIVLYHYAPLHAFSRIIASTNLRHLRASYAERAHFGDGVYATQFAPHQFGSVNAILLNNYTNKTDPVEQERQIAAWRQKGVTDYCIPVIVPRAAAVNVREQTTREMLWPGHTARDNCPIRDGRDVWVIVIQDDAGQACSAEEHVDAMYLQIQHPDWSVRMHAVEVLAGMAASAYDQRATHALLECLRDENSHVCVAAVWGVAGSKVLTVRQAQKHIEYVMGYNFDSSVKDAVRDACEFLLDCKKPQEEDSDCESFLSANDDRDYEDVNEDTENNDTDLDLPIISTKRHANIEYGEVEVTEFCAAVTSDVEECSVATSFHTEGHKTTTRYNMMSVQPLYLAV